MAITKRMGEIFEAHEAGIAPEVLAVRYGISKNSVIKKVEKVRFALKPRDPEKVPSVAAINKNSRWNESNIKKGIDRYITEFGRMPTSRDFDESSYLPSARQIQRAYGGLVTLRERLGYAETDFTKGTLRKKIAINANKRGLGAEDYFEPILIEKFGEPFVHVQKRYYKGSKSRYDFLVYAQDIVFGIDIFTTDRVNYIEKNVRHKITRYKNAPRDLVIYFVLVGEDYTQVHADKAAQSIADLKNYPNMIVMHEQNFMNEISAYSALPTPTGFVGLELLESAN